MKKLLLVLAIGAFVASCNDSGTAEGTKPADSTATTTAPVDSTAKPVDSTAKPVDSTAKPATDTTKK